MCIIFFISYFKIISNFKIYSDMIFIKLYTKGYFPVNKDYYSLSSTFRIIIITTKLLTHINFFFYVSLLIRNIV